MIGCVIRTADWIEALDRPDAPVDPAGAAAILVDYPVVLGGVMNERTVDLLRELQLMTSGGSSHPEVGVVRELRDLAAHTTAVWGDRLAEPNVELRRALAAGLATTNLEYPMAPGMRRSVLDYARMMETIDDYCRRAALMTLAPAPDVYALRRWTVEEFVRQFDGLAPRPWRSRTR
jgi:hypothetical protein